MCVHEIVLGCRLQVKGQPKILIYDHPILDT
jgi:hypothetical protein